MARSLIAGVNALFRREERRLPPERRLVDDPYAAALVEWSPLVAAIRALRLVWPSMRRSVDQLRTAHCVRHASIDALIGRGLADGYRQVVVLGAGYDMRAARLGERWPEARWFEIDRRAMLARKGRRLEGRVPSERRAVAVGMDLSCEPALPRLVEEGFQPDQPAIIVAEGLIHYLPSQLTLKLLDGLLGGGPRRAVISFIQPEMVRRASDNFRWLVSVLREIPRVYYTTEAMSLLAARFGLHPQFYDWEAQVGSFAPAAAGRPHGVWQMVVSMEAAPDVALTENPAMY